MKVLFFLVALSLVAAQLRSSRGSRARSSYAPQSSYVAGRSYLPSRATSYSPQHSSTRGRPVQYFGARNGQAPATYMPYRTSARSPARSHFGANSYNSKRLYNNQLASSRYGPLPPPVKQLETTEAVKPAVEEVVTTEVAPVLEQLAEVVEDVADTEDAAVMDMEKLAKMVDEIVEEIFDEKEEDAAGYAAVKMPEQSDDVEVHAVVVGEKSYSIADARRSSFVEDDDYSIILPLSAAAAQDRRQHNSPDALKKAAKKSKRNTKRNKKRRKKKKNGKKQVAEEQEDQLLVSCVVNIPMRCDEGMTAPQLPELKYPLATGKANEKCVEIPRHYCIPVLGKKHGFVSQDSDSL